MYLIIQKLYFAKCPTMHLNIIDIDLSADELSHAEMQGHKKPFLSGIPSLIPSLPYFIMLSIRNLILKASL
jgi:hypothetical protein